MRPQPGAARPLWPGLVIAAVIIISTATTIIKPMNCTRQLVDPRHDTAAPAAGHHKSDQQTSDIWKPTDEHSPVRTQHPGPRSPTTSATGEHSNQLTGGQLGNDPWAPNEPARLVKRWLPETINSAPQYNQPAGRNVTSSLPEFSAPIGNVSAVVGRDVRLVCTVENLGQYQVAWLKEETRTILSIDTNIIITNYRIFLIPDEEARKWVLHIKDVQESDRGFYQCQVNTNPMRSTSGYLEVVVPPSIIEAQTSQMAEVVEHSNVSIQCKASGHPRPTITWRREDGQAIRLIGHTRGSHTSVPLEAAASPEPARPAGSTQQIAGHANQAPEPDTHDNQEAAVASQLDDVKSDKLTLIGADRFMAGLYACTATNGIPGPQATKRIPLYVRLSEHDQLEVDCLIEAYPKADSYWTRHPAGPAARSQPKLSRQPQRHRLVPRVARGLQPPPGGATRRPANPNRLHWGPPGGDTLGDTGGPPPASKWRQLVAPTGLSVNDVARAGSPDLTRRPPMQSGSQVTDQSIRIHRASAHEPAGHGWPSPAGPQPDAQRPASAPTGQSASRPGRAAGRDLGPANQAEPTDELVSANESETIDELENDQEAAKPWSSLHQIGAKNLIDNQQQHQHQPARANRVSVKQTPVNSYTWRLRLTIERMEAEDFGQYSCVATNQLGSSEAHVWVTRADKPESQLDLGDGGQRSVGAGAFASSSVASNELDLYQRDSLMVVTEMGANNQHQRRLSGNDKAEQPHLQALAGARQRLTGGQNRVVYDENYLQAIKNRGLASGAGPGSLVGAQSGRQLQQKLRMKQSSSATPIEHNLVPLLVATLVALMLSL